MNPLRGGAIFRQSTCIAQVLRYLPSTAKLLFNGCWKTQLSFKTWRRKAMVACERPSPGALPMSISRAYQPHAATSHPSTLKRLHHHHNPHTVQLSQPFKLPKVQLSGHTRWFIRCGNRHRGPSATGFGHQHQLRGAISPSLGSNANG